MYQHSFDGTPRALDLFSRIGAEERVGDSLSPDTINLYARKIRQVARRKAQDKVQDLTPELLVRDLTERIEQQDITRATARVEKSAALFWLAEQAQKILDTGSTDFARYESAYRDVLDLGTKELPKNSGKTSGRKLKAFPDEAVEVLEKAALTDRSVSLKYALLFIRANLMVGLRPVEWFNSNLISYLHRDAFGDYKYTLDGEISSSNAIEVLNAKHSSIRGNGESRTIVLETLDNRQLTHLQRWLQAIEVLRTNDLDELSEAAINKKVFGSLQRAIRRVLTKAGWIGEIPTIYSTRHQAVANAKADGQSQREIAALFGHSSTETARQHYGKKYSGYSGRSMRAAPESVLAVRSIATHDTSSWVDDSLQSEARPGQK